jgi:curved DNA-binding protein CbpA
MASSTNARDYYRALGVSPGATAEEVKQAYLGRLRAMHPALIASRDATAFRRLRRAYEVLANPAERTHYDMLLGVGAYAGRMRSYRRSFSRLFDTLARNRQAARPMVFWPAEEATSAQRKAG